jgi:hypothetical protein
MATFLGKRRVMFPAFFINDCTCMLNSLTVRVFSPANLAKAKDGRKFMLRLLGLVRRPLCRRFALVFFLASFAYCP